MNTTAERLSVDTLISLLAQTARINPKRADQFQAIAAILQSSRSALSFPDSPTCEWRCDECGRSVLIAHGAEVFDCVSCGSGSFTKLAALSSPSVADSPTKE